MSASLPSSIVEDLQGVVDECLETFSSRQHHISDALEHDISFRDDRRPLSALRRSLLKDAVRRGANRSDRLHVHERAPGGGLRFSAWIDQPPTEAQFSLRTAAVDRDGNYEVLATSDPFESLGVGEPESFYRPVPFVLACTVTGDGVGQFFAAEVLGLDEQRVARLRLGQIVELGGSHGSEPTTPLGSFKPDDDDTLDGFEDDSEGDEGTSGAV